MGNQLGSYGEPVGNRVRFVGNRVFGDVWGLRFLYILGVKTPDRLFPFIKLNGETGPRAALAAGSAAPRLPVHFILEFYQRLWSANPNSEFYPRACWGFSLGLPE